ncbi:LPXTG cell wall anchor domain-containing protein, partial [Thomasclavelia cocleata]|uniref:LPXTG cell wall anchor domain-containing protein n=1 Tax=Thomasclavelia cocleata TaxID=69824 RepID=UPI0025A01686
YSAASLKLVDDVMEKASAVLNNPEATKEEVETAQIALQSVLDKLVTKDVSNVQVPSSDVKVVNNGESSALKTGDNSMVVPFAFTGLLAFASGVIVFKKKKD